MGDYWGTEEGKLQILYLRHELKLSLQRISEITHYAISTVSRVLKTYKERINEALELFFYDVKKRFIPTSADMVEWECEMVADGIPCAYVTEIYNNDKRVCLKVGFSEHMEDRMYAHATNKKYGGNRVVVRKVYQFADVEQALTMENALRKYYKEKNNCADFIEKDRFTEQIPTIEDYNKFELKANFIIENF